MRVFALLLALLCVSSLPAKVSELSTVDASDRPPGFPKADEFTSAEEACKSLVPRLVSDPALHQPILKWCLARAYYSSRNVTVVSRIDGTQIHDRDRPHAWSFYTRGVRAGYLDPDRCEHHVVDKSIERPAPAKQIWDRWPYRTHCDYAHGSCSSAHPGRILDPVREKWKRRPYDAEKHGTRGPFDHNHWEATKYLGGCWPAVAMERFDVGASTTIERSEDFCERLVRRTKGKDRCRTAADVRRIWSPRFWRDLAQLQRVARSAPR
jgi:hypothetical protein